MSQGPCKSADLSTRLDQLGAGARFESCGPVYQAGPEPGQDGPIYVATAWGGRKVRLLKVLLTNRCQNACAYCAFRSERDLARTQVSPDELARCFHTMHLGRRVDGLFLSSGIEPSAVVAMDRQIAVADLLRHKYGFRGYIHLKVLPGADAAQIEAASRLATRLSLNLEAPSRERLKVLAPGKAHADRIRDHIKSLAGLSSPDDGTPRGRWTTQFVVGPAGETDHELLGTTAALYRSFHMSRAYFSRFEPVPDTPLAEVPATSRIRQNRLYQADTLMRFYGFGFDELCFDPSGSLPSAVDPKLAWARLHPDRFPVDLVHADRETLLRVPGLGPTVVSRILVARASGGLRSLEDLRRLGARTSRCGEWVHLGGRNVGGTQLRLFDPP